MPVSGQRCPGQGQRCPPLGPATWVASDPEGPSQAAIRWRASTPVWAATWVASMLVDRRWPGSASVVASDLVGVISAAPPTPVWAATWWVISDAPQRLCGQRPG